MGNSTRPLILQALSKQPETVQALAGLIRVTPHAIRSNLRVLYASGEVRIGGWVRHSDRGPFTPLYKLGQGKDATKPKAITDAERMRRRRRENPDYRMNELVQKRKSRALKKAAAPKPKQPKPRYWVGVL